jgi:hypothetical protein
MSIYHLLRWLGHTSFSVLIRRSTWAFATIEIVHLLGLAILGGAILIVDLRLLGVGLRRQTVSRTARELLPLLLSGLGAMLISGALMLTAFPMKYYHSPAFRLKMVLLLLALCFYFTVHRHVVRPNSDAGETATSIWSKAVALVSLALWLGVGLAGRAIGFFGLLLI